MARLILLDSGPLGLTVRAPISRKSFAITRGSMASWQPARRSSSPRSRTTKSVANSSESCAVGSLRRLDFALDPSSGFDHLTLTTDAIIKAAEFWAFVRQTGIPTASPDALDADAILAGQAALAGQPGDTVTIATTNLAHLDRFPGSMPRPGIRSSRHLARPIARRSPRTWQRY